MIEKIRFPMSCQPQRYYNRHPRYVLETIRAAGIAVQLCRKTSVAHCCFAIDVDGWEVAIDFSNFPDLPPCHRRFDHWFKFHCTEGLHEKVPHVHPFPVVSFYDWRRYQVLSGCIRYAATGDLVVNMQRPHAAATQRRLMVQAMLRREYGARVAIELASQPDFWRRAGRCLVAVFVPGARNDMLDRGHAQYLALGCCTISPYIRTLLPAGHKLVAGEHYLCCGDDYSDLIEKIDWCRTHRAACRQIGAAAKDLFIRTSTPRRIWEWVQQCLSAA